MQYDQPIRFHGESDELPDKATGDLIFVLKPKEEEDDKDMPDFKYIFLSSLSFFLSRSLSPLF